MLFANDPLVFVAGDNLIYPVEDNPAICVAPDVYVAFGRKKGYRGSYKVWKEGGIFPQVVFEVLSPGNTAREMKEKRKFYQTHGADEYYVIDPDTLELEGYVRGSKGFVAVPEMNGFKSPRLGITFSQTEDDIELKTPGGSRFLSFVEYGQLQYQTSLQAAEERHRAEQERIAKEAERLRADKLAAKLRALGIDPDTI